MTVNNQQIVRSSQPRVPPRGNEIANRLYAALPRDTRPRTLPHTLPGPAIDADGNPVPEEDRVEQIFEDGVYIAVDGIVARRLQEFINCNRPRSEANVNRLYDSMCAGEWQYNGKSSLLVCSNTSVLDSQHSLEAARRYFEEAEVDHVKKPILMRVEMGLPPGVFSTYDIGRKRSLGDTLAVESARGVVRYGNVPHHTMAQAALVLVQYFNNVYDLATDDINYLPNERAGLPNSRAAEILQMYPQLPRSAQFVHSLGSFRGITNPAVLTVAHMLIADVESEEAANEFARKLLSGSNLPEGSPILALRTKCVQVVTTKNIRVSGIELLAYYTRAWNMFATGRTLMLGSRSLKGFSSDRKIVVPVPISPEVAAALQSS